jgi:lipoprotein-anchoring transpeptidase ErfK/SrfK
VTTGDGRPFTVPGTTTPHVGATPIGTFTVDRAVPTTIAAPLGTLSLPLYFHGPWAIHGGAVVPPYPASHGCVRTHDWDQAWLFAQVPVGTPVVVVGAGAPRALPAGAAAGY